MVSGAVLTLWLVVEEGVGRRTRMSNFASMLWWDHRSPFSTGHFFNHGLCRRSMNHSLFTGLLITAVVGVLLAASGIFAGVYLTTPCSELQNKFRLKSRIMYLPRTLITQVFDSIICVHASVVPVNMLQVYRLWCYYWSWYLASTDNNNNNCTVLYCKLWTQA